jgi:PAS domain S-box-containing protein
MTVRPIDSSAGSDLPTLAFLSAEGDMAARMRRHDWSRSPLGAPATWSPSLKTLVGLMLASPQPMFMAWGQERTWLYNDAFIPILGVKHPAALGRHALDEVWREARETLLPMFDRVYAGEPVHMQEFSLPLDRNGRLEDAYFAFSYIPARDETGSVAGLFGACIETTDRVLAERRQAAAQARQQRMFEQAPSFMCILRGPDHVFEFVNNAHRKLFSSDDWIGKPAREAFPDLANQGYFDLLDQVFASGERYVATSAPVRFRRTPGRREEERLLDFIYEPIADDAGRVTGIFCEGFDVTEARRSEFALRESETRFREIADAAPVMMWICDVTAARTWFNRAWLEFANAPLQDEYGDLWVARVHPSDTAARSARFLEAFERRERFRIDFRLRRADGTWRIVDETGVPRFASNGTFLGYIGSCTDVTEQREAERALKRSEEQLRLATEAAEVGLWDVDLVTNTLYWPPRVKRMFGISPDVVVSLADFYAGLHPQDRDAVSAAFAAAIEPTQRALYDVEYRTIGKEDGIMRWVAAKGRGIFDDGGSCIRVIGTALDISARKQSEAQLREREERLRAIVETTPECVKLVARNGRLLQMNPSGLAMIEAPAAEYVVGRNVLELIAPEHREAFRRFNERVCDGEKATLEFDVIGLLGSRRHVETHGAPLRMPDGTVVQLGLTRDVTARRVAEEALRQSDRRKDEFIATLSHELRNPLAPLRNALQILQMRAAQDAADASIHAMMERQVNHLVRLVDDLLEVSRIKHGAFELRSQRVELATVVRNAVETCEPLMHEGGHRLDVTLPNQRVWLCGDPVRLGQILANLLNNAARYTPHGGRISVHAQIVSSILSISVIDTGAGFAKEAGARLFEMFSRGKNSSGLGIGLALARRLAELHGGTIKAASAGPGQGAEFTVSLPLPPDQSSTPAEKPLGSDSFRGHRILVVDDNQDAAESIRSLLELLNADARVAFDGMQALALFSEYDANVVLLDIGMPGMDGYEVARTLRERHPGRNVHIVALTGWGQEQDRARTREAGFDRHLVKPVDFETLQALFESLPLPSAAATVASAGPERGHATLADAASREF